MLTNGSKKNIVLLIAFSITVFISLSAFADMGPKPSMEFTFTFETTSPLEIGHGFLMQCQDSNCTDPFPLEEVGPQGFTCQTDQCSSIAYGYTEFSYLEITFSDGVIRQSNTFGKEHFDALYEVTVYEDHLEVIETGGRMNPMGLTILTAVGFSCLLFGSLMSLFFIFIVLSIKGKTQSPSFENDRGWLIAVWVISAILTPLAATFYLTIPITILIEFLLTLAYLLIRKKPKALTLTLVLIANLITQFVFLTAIATFYITLSPSLMGLEVVIIAIEAFILYWPQRTTFTLKEALLLSTILNITSFGLGLLLPF